MVGSALYALQRLSSKIDSVENCIDGIKYLQKFDISLLEALKKLALVSKYFH